jgi:hypothetical protein
MGLRTYKMKMTSLLRASSIIFFLALGVSFLIPSNGAYAAGSLDAGGSANSGSNFGNGLDAGGSAGSGASGSGSFGSLGNGSVNSGGTSASGSSSLHPLTFSDLVSKTIGLINLVIPLLFTLALVLFLWTGVRYIRQAGGEGASEVRGQLAWGLIALFVIFSVWGLVNILCFTFFGHSCGS